VSLKLLISMNLEQHIKNQIGPATKTINKVLNNMYVSDVPKRIKGVEPQASSPHARPKSWYDIIIASSA
jgi:hypothetical protein